MARAARQPAQAPLDPALRKIVEAMARAQAERDFRAALAPPDVGLPDPSI